MRRRAEDDGRATSRRWRVDPALALPAVALCLLPGCVGELGALAAMTFGMTMGAWFVSRERQRRSLLEAASMRRALASGEHRQVERRLRRELAPAAAGEHASPERVWLARAQLAGLLVAEWRLDEAAEIYAMQDPGLSPHLRALAAFGRHELEVLCVDVDGQRLTGIRRDRQACLEHVPGPFQLAVARAWGALEGLALARMGKTREAIALLEEGLEAVRFNPARIIYVFHLAQAYERIGHRDLALGRYHEATQLFPGTRLASEARSRIAAIQASASLFRGMLPEAPAPALTPEQAAFEGAAT
ncbi:MAG: hypothetical protein H6710_06330 [Myxococcales bacterium]|nr:hypothetical protein [Myxococcales bacterium]